MTESVGISSSYPQDIGSVITNHEDDVLIFNCPDCRKETDAHMFVDRRNYGSGTTWVVCDSCYGPNGGMWELEDMLDRVRVEA